MQQDGSASDREKGEAAGAAEAGPGLMGRLLGVPRAVGDGVSGAVDAATGHTFREQFEEFTDAVTTTVIGVHHDQAKLTAKMALLDEAMAQEIAGVRQEQAGLHEQLSSLGDAMTREAAERANLTEKSASLDAAVAREAAGARQERADSRERLASMERRLLAAGGVAAASLVVSVAALLAALGVI